MSKTIIDSSCKKHEIESVLSLMLDGGYIMFRHNYNGKEIIIRFTSNSKSTKVNKDFLYKKIVSICESIMTADHETPFIVEDDRGRLAVGTVQHGDLTVISIHHFVEPSHMYLQRNEVKKPS